MRKIAPDNGQKVVFLQSLNDGGWSVILCDKKQKMFAFGNPSWPGIPGWLHKKNY